MRLLFNSNHYLVSYYRHHSKIKIKPKHTEQNNTLLEPYDYFLNHTYVPTYFLGISTENLSIINRRELKDIIKKIGLKEGDKKLNYPLIQRITKVRMLLLFLLTRHSKQHFLTETNINIRKIDAYSDHKYSELYEEGLITKIVQTFKDYQILQPITRRRQISNFLQKILKQGQNLHHQINQICQYFSITWQNKDTALRQISSQMQYRRHQTPMKLFEYMNKIYQYTNHYNLVKGRNNQYNFDDEYLKKVLTCFKNNQQEYVPVIKGQVKYFQNVKITTVDYLVALEFIISSKSIKKDFISRLINYSNHYRHKQMGGVLKGRLFQVVLLARMFQFISSNIQIYSFSQDEKLQIQKQTSFYFEQLAKIMQNLTFMQLHTTLGHHLKIIQKYLIVNFNDEVTLNRFKQIYHKIFSTIFDYEQNGILLVQSSKDVNFIFQAILCLYNNEDEQIVLELVEKYQKILLVNPFVIQDKVTFKYRALYMVCLKYGFKSDIFGEKLFGELHKQQLRNQQKRFPLLSEIFDYFIYLNIIETKTKISGIIQNKWVSQLQKIELSYIHQSKRKSHRVNPFYGRQNRILQQIERIEQQQNPKPNNQLKYQITQLYQMLLMMSKTLQNNPSQEILFSIKKKFQKLIKQPAFRNCIQNYISYPKIYQYLCVICDKLDSKEIKRYKFHLSTFISSIVNNNKSEGVKCSQRVLYQENVYFACNLVGNVREISQFYGPHRVNTIKIKKQKKQKKEDEKIISIQHAKTMLQLIFDYAQAKIPKAQEKPRLLYKYFQPVQQASPQKEPTSISEEDNKKQEIKQESKTFFKNKNLKVNNVQQKKQVNPMQIQPILQKIIEAQPIIQIREILQQNKPILLTKSQAKQKRKMIFLQNLKKIQKKMQQLKALRSKTYNLLKNNRLVEYPYYNQNQNQLQKMIKKLQQKYNK